MAKQTKSSAPTKKPTSINGFSRRWENLGKYMGVLKGLSESGGEAFEVKYSDFLGLLKSIYPGDETSWRVPVDSQSRLAFAQSMAADYRNYVINYSTKNIKEIIGGLKDKLQDFALTVLPLNKDEESRADNLEGLIKDHEKVVTSLESGLSKIDKNSRPEAYKSQERALAQFKDKASVLTDYKDLIKNIVAYRELVSNTGALDGQPRNDKLQDLSSRVLKGILDGFGKDSPKYRDNVPIVFTIKRLLESNSNFLMAFYSENILQLAKVKLEESVGKVDLKDYSGRSVKVVDEDKQVEYLNRIYSIDRENKRTGNLNKTYSELYGIPKFNFRKAA